MHRRALLLGVLALSVGFAATAGAAPPATATGTISAEDFEFAEVVRGPNLFVHIQTTGAMDGTFAGSQVSTYDEVVNATGSSTLQGTLVCDPCTVDGRLGRVVFDQVGSITIGGEPFFSLELRTVAVSATGGLAGLRANLVVRWDGESDATYEGWYRLGP
jgi:hypothetical protein